MSKKNNEMEVFVSKDSKTINDVIFSLIVTKNKSFIHLNCTVSDHYSAFIPVSFDICFESMVDLLYNKHLEKILKSREYVDIVKMKKNFEKENSWLKIIK